MKERNTVFTINKGPLKIIEPFEFLRGKENRDTSMGLATDGDGRFYRIFPAPCDSENGITGSCYCAARAVRIANPEFKHV